jgi:hypothetical protein
MMLMITMTDEVACYSNHKIEAYIIYALKVNRTIENKFFSNNFGCMVVRNKVKQNKS